MGPIPKLVVKKYTMQYISSSLQKAKLIRSLYHDRLIHRSIPPFSQCICRYKLDQIASKKRLAEAKAVVFEAISHTKRTIIIIYSVTMAP